MKNLFEQLITGVERYVTNCKLESMVLGISGGIDSTVVAAICSEVEKRTGVILITRSLMVKNKADERLAADLVGKAFSSSTYRSCNLSSMYGSFLESYASVELDGDCNEESHTIEYLEDSLGFSKIAYGNIQARLRMIHLYNLAGVNRGIVMDTDNLTEHNLGFFTIHGDDGDLNPLASLWKTDVYSLARYLVQYYQDLGEDLKVDALMESIALIPTDGNGVSSSDLEQIGGKDYFEVDRILKCLLSKEQFGLSRFNKETVAKIKDRHEKSFFKRQPRPLPIKSYKRNNLLVIVDMQNDFVNPEKGSLYVPGADVAVNNLVKLLTLSENRLFDKLIVSKDTHQVYSGMSSFWKEDVKPFSKVTLNNVVTGTVSPAIEGQFEDVVNYLKETEAINIWPDHCIKDTWGWDLDPKIQSCLDNFKGFPIYEEVWKGWREDIKDSYSMLRLADNTESKDFENLADEFSKYEKIYIAGVAKDICVANLVKDLIVDLGVGDKLVFLTDCMATLDENSKSLAIFEEAVSDFKAKNMTVSETLDLL